MEIVRRRWRRVVLSSTVERVTIKAGRERRLDGLDSRVWAQKLEVEQRESDRY